MKKQSLRFTTVLAALFLGASVAWAQSVNWDANPINGLQSFVVSARTKAARRLSPAKNPYKTLPLGWLEPDVPAAFTAPAKDGRWNYPADGTATTILLVVSGCKEPGRYDNLPAAAYVPDRLSASMCGKPRLRYIYRWTPRSCAASPSAACRRATVVRSYEFSGLDIDRKSGVVRLPPDYPAAAAGVVIAKIWPAPAGAPAALAELLKPYSAVLKISYDAGNEAALHCSYDDARGGWTGCDHKPVVPYYVGTLHLEGPGLDPACDADIAHPQFGCPLPGHRAP